eukprot:15450514-Alexandrium_andersonii.AAC.1
MEAEDELSPDIGEEAANPGHAAAARERRAALHDAPEPVGVWAAYVAGREWRPGAPTFCSTSLTIGLAALLQMVFQGAMDIGTAWRRLVTLLVGLLAQDLGAAALVTLEGAWGISGRIVEAVR